MQKFCFKMHYQLFYFLVFGKSLLFKLILIYMCLLKFHNTYFKLPPVKKKVILLKMAIMCKKKQV